VQSLDVRVNGYPLALGAGFGDVEMSTVYPGGSGELSWSVTDMRADLAVGWADVEAYCGPQRVWLGRFTEPDPSQDRLVAQGLWRLGDNFSGLDGSGNANAVPDTVIDQAIARGLPWTRPVSIGSTATSIDITQGPVGVGTILDTRAENNTLRWGVDENGAVWMQADPTSPSYQTLPLDGGLGYATDNYASTLVGRYLNSATSTYATKIVTDSVAERNHTHKEAVVDLTPRGAITTSQATGYLTAMLALGRAIPEYTAGMAFTYGEILTIGGAPIALEAVQAGRIVRVHGGLDFARRLQGQMYLDVIIGQTTLSGGQITLQPLGYVGRSLEDALTLAISQK
jgi:hypothetical protein